MDWLWLWLCLTSAFLALTMQDGITFTLAYRLSPIDFFRHLFFQIQFARNQWGGDAKKRGIVAAIGVYYLVCEGIGNILRVVRIKKDHNGSITLDILL